MAEMDRFIENNPFYGPRTNEKFEQIQAIVRAEIEAARVERLHEMIVLVLIAIAATAVVAFFAYRSRRGIGRVVDAAAVSGLAMGVRIARNAATKKAALVGRVLAKANGSPPPKE